jgi:tetratricopeptide (TPR) repeat protein
MRLRSVVVTLMLAGLLPAASLLAQKQAPMTSPEERAALHNSTEWQLIQPHLPNPQTATATALETAGDVLRARRYPEDALDYYGYAMSRGGNVSALLNKMGIIRLELHQDDLARQMFLRTVRAKKNDAQAWNNLGVTEFSEHNYRDAIADYKRATRLDKHSGVYHSNLGMAYFENKDIDNARLEFAAAIRLEPSIMSSRDGGGMTAHVLGSENYPELCFEMAKLYARNHNAAQARLWLAKASEGGYDVHSSMADDQFLLPYLKDPEVKLMLANSAQMRKRAVAKTTTAPSLGTSPENQQIVD